MNTKSDAVMQSSPEPTLGGWHTESPVECDGNGLHLTFCEPDVERFREERLKVLPGPLVSMLKSLWVKLTEPDFTDLSPEWWQLRSSAATSASETGQKNSQVPAVEATRAWQKLPRQVQMSKVSHHEKVSGLHLSSVQLTPDWQDRDPSQGYKSLNDTLDT